ncbi:hypothetical protein C029_02040 [Brucella abortus 88/19]|nr:hypothetical protein C029_02040 [Brucella abortus 88/19]
MKYRFILLLGIASVFTMPAMAEVQAPQPHGMNTISNNRKFLYF